MTELFSFHIQFCVVMRHFLEWNNAVMFDHGYVDPASIYRILPHIRPDPDLDLDLVLPLFPTPMFVILACIGPKSVLSLRQL